MSSDSPAVFDIKTLSIICSGAIFAGAMTWYLAQDISSVKESAERNYGTIMARVSGDEARITAMEKLLSDRNTDEASFRTEQRNGLATLTNSLADLRVELAKRR